MDRQSPWAREALIGQSFSKKALSILPAHWLVQRTLARHLGPASHVFIQ